MQFLFYIILNFFILLVIGKAKEMSFRRDLKMLMEGANQIAIGKEFQSLGPIIEKALSPKRTLCAPVAL